MKSSHFPIVKFNIIFSSLAGPDVTSKYFVMERKASNR